MENLKNAPSMLFSKKKSIRIWHCEEKTLKIKKLGDLWCKLYAIVNKTIQCYIWWFIRVCSRRVVKQKYVTCISKFFFLEYHGYLKKYSLQYFPEFDKSTLRSFKFTGHQGQLPSSLFASSWNTWFEQKYLQWLYVETAFISTKEHPFNA